MSIQRVERDLNRFRQIVRGKIKKDLRKYMSQGEMIGRQGRKYVSIPLPQIDIPQFRYGSKQGGGVGQGEGEVGDPIGQCDPQQGQGEAGADPGQHVIEVDITLEELAQILGEELQLPNIEPRGKKNIVSQKDRYSGIRKVGPDSLRHFKRTYREALKRQISSAYKLCQRMIEERYSPDEWNIYPFHFSDGDNWGGGDTRECVEILRSQLLPRVNQFCYGQVRSLYGSGRFAHDLEEYLGKEETLVISEIADRDDIYDAIKDFLGKGK